MQRFGLPLVHPIPSALGASQETESADQLIDFPPSLGQKCTTYFAKKLAIHRVEHRKLTNCKIDRRKILFLLNVNTLDKSLDFGFKIVFRDGTVPVPLIQKLKFK